MIEVGPFPADHLPAKLAQNVLTQLLLIDHIAAVLGRIQLPTVLDLAVELPDRPTLLPGEVDPGGESTVVIEDLKLQLRCRDARFEKASSAPRLPGNLAANVDESRNTAGTNHARPAAHPLKTAQELRPVQSSAHRRVTGNHRGLKRQGTRQVSNRTGNARCRNAVNLDDL